jgi:hypothetical protein
MLRVSPTETLRESKDNKIQTYGVLNKSRISCCFGEERANKSMIGLCFSRERKMLRVSPTETLRESKDNKIQTYGVLNKSRI